MKEPQIKQEIFDDIKRCALAIWSTYDDTYWYATAKKDRVKEIDNVWDNVDYIIAMFDLNNQYKLLALLGDEARLYVQYKLCDDIYRGLYH